MRGRQKIEEVCAIGVAGHLINGPGCIRAGREREATTCSVVDGPNAHHSRVTGGGADRSGSRLVAACSYDERSARAQLRDNGGVWGRCVA